MIVFDLKCGAGHVFEAWFGSSDAFESQRASSLIQCPMCGDGDVAKAVMAPNVGTKGNQSPAIAPETLKAALAAVAEIQSKMLEKSQWVGTAFADKARAMHLGETPQTQIHGQATANEARELIEEGVPVAPLLVPIVPPEACN
jgi:hypothetical protein